LLGVRAASAGAPASDADRAKAAANLVARSELAAGLTDDSEQREIKDELLRVNDLLRQALADESAAVETGARSVVDAECTRLQPLVSRFASAEGDAPASEWARIRIALADLCGMIAAIAASNDRAERRSLAEAFLERVGKRDPARDYVGPTIRLPGPRERRVGQP
jgi:hypothetical protein